MQDKPNETFPAGSHSLSRQLSSAGKCLTLRRLGRFSCSPRSSDINADNYCLFRNQTIKFLSSALLLIIFAVNANGFTLTIDGNNNESFLSVNTVSGDDLQFPLWDRDNLSSGWILDIDGSYTAPADNGWIREYREAEGNHRLIYSNRAYSFENNAVISSGGSHILITVRF